jgi:hypothetical protein
VCGKDLRPSTAPSLSVSRWTPGAAVTAQISGSIEREAAELMDVVAVPSLKATTCTVFYKFYADITRQLPLSATVAVRTGHPADDAVGNEWDAGGDTRLGHTSSHGNRETLHSAATAASATSFCGLSRPGTYGPAKALGLVTDRPRSRLRRASAACRPQDPSGPGAPAGRDPGRPLSPRQPTTGKARIRCSHSGG